MFSQVARAARSCAWRRIQTITARPQRGKRMSTYDHSKRFTEQEWMNETTAGARFKGMAAASIPWARKNPVQAAAIMAFIVLELTPYGPTGNLLWLPYRISQSRKEKALKDKETYDTVEMHVPSGKEGGDTVEVQNPHVPGVTFKCTVPKGKKEGDAFKVKLPRKL